MPITNPEQVKRIKRLIEEQEHMYRDTKSENRRKAGDTSTKLPKNSERKPKSNYASRPNRTEKKLQKKKKQKRRGAEFTVSATSAPVSMKSMPEDKNKQNNIADDMIRWFHEHPDELLLSSYPLACGVPPTYFRQTRHHNTYFANAIDYVEALLAQRKMDRITYFKKYGINNTSLLEKRFPVYDREYREYQQERDERKAQQTTVATQIQTVEIPSTPSSEMVPEHTVDSESSSDQESET